MGKTRYELVKSKKISDGNGTTLGVVVLDKQFLEGNKISGYIVRKINYLAPKENGVFNNTFFDKKKEALEGYEKALKKWNQSKNKGGRK